MRTNQNRFRKQNLIQAGGVAALSMLAGTAEAAIVYSGVQNQLLSGDANSFNLDLNGDTSIDISMTSFIFGSDFGINVFQQNSTLVGSFIQNKSVFTTRFADGASIGVGSLQSVNSASRLFDTFSPEVMWNSTTTAGYLGFKLSNGDYGWMYINTTLNGAGSSITVRDWAYESVANTAITAGAGITAVPEPSTVTLMLLPIALLALKRLRVRR